MSGHHHDLRRFAVSAIRDYLHVSADILSAVDSLIALILDTQYITAPQHRIFDRDERSLHVATRLWKVLIGSGMGLAFAGELSDMCIHMIEKDWLLSLVVRRRFGIRFYHRFKDDLIFAIDAPSSQRLEFFRLLKSRSSFFALDVGMAVHCGSSTPFCNFLDLTLGFGERWTQHGELDIYPYRNSRLYGVRSACALPTIRRSIEIGRLNI